MSVAERCGSPGVSLGVNFPRPGQQMWFWTRTGREEKKKKKKNPIIKFHFQGDLSPEKLCGLFMSHQIQAYHPNISSCFSCLTQTKMRKSPVRSSQHCCAPLWESPISTWSNFSRKLTLTAPVLSPSVSTKLVSTFLSFS